MKERRKDERVKVELEASWEGALTQLGGSIVDLSTSGCFVLTDDKVKVGELIRVIIHQPQQDDLYIWGEVVYQIPEMGFAVRFTGADDADTKQLELIVKAELYGAKKSEAKD